MANKGLDTDSNFVWFMTLLFVVFIFPIGVFPSLIITNLIRQEVVSSIFEASLLASSFYYTYVLIQWPIGLFLDKYGVILILRSCIILSVVGLITFYFSDDFFVAVLSRILNGLAGGAAIPAALFIAHHGFNHTKFLILAGIVEFLAMSSAGVSQLVLSTFVQAGDNGWRGVVLVFTLVGIFLSFIYFIFIKSTHKVYHDFENEPEQLKNKFCYSSHVLINGLVSGCLFSFTNAFFGFWCIHYLHAHSYFLSKTMAAFYSCIGFVAAGISIPVIGYFVRDLSQQYVVLLWGIIFTCFFSVLIMLQVLPASLLPFIIFLAGASSGVYVIPFSFVSKNCPNFIVGTTMAVVNTLCGSIGSLIIIPLIGLLIDKQLGFGFSLDFVIYCFPFVFFVALCLVVFKKNTLLSRQVRL